MTPKEQALAKLRSALLFGNDFTIAYAEDRAKERGATSAEINTTWEEVIALLDVE